MSLKVDIKNGNLRFFERKFLFSWFDIDFWVNICYIFYWLEHLRNITEVVRVGKVKQNAVLHFNIQRGDSLFTDVPG